MTEVNITVRAFFDDEAQAKDATKELKAAARRSGHDLTKAINSLYPIENCEDYPALDIEDITRKRANVTILAYTGRTEPVVWFAESLSKLGPTRIFIREEWDEGGSNHYFLKGKRVSKKTYDASKPKRPLSARDIEINKNLFLPEGRVTVKATLVSHWYVDDIYESIGLEFVTDDGITFYYKGRGQLTQMISDDSPKTCQFDAAFERGRLKGEYVSFAKRPTKVKIG